MLVCEGACSDVYRESRSHWIHRMRIAGFPPASVRAILTGDMVTTAHLFSRHRVNRETQTRTTYYRCTGCGHERVYGVEDV